IARALHTCINQTFKDIEIIVVDDCGEDKSIAIAKEYAKQDSRIKIIHNHENLKLLRARYEGVKAASSPYIMFLDPDDYLELDACKICSLYFDKNFDFIWFNLKFDNKLQEKPLKDLFLTHEEYIKYALVGNISYLWNICSKLISKRTYEQALIC
ncbi:glycosyltransferase family 2 protein, partial [Campylobacter hepaticus]